MSLPDLQRLHQAARIAALCVEGRWFLCRRVRHVEHRPGLVIVRVRTRLVPMPAVLAGRRRAG
jgi:hypothetical protein